jgi:hypothetical protein
MGYFKQSLEADSVCPQFPNWNQQQLDELFEAAVPLHIFKNSVRTAKKTQHFTVITIKWLTLFKEIIAVNIENHTEPVNIKLRVTNCSNRWYI